jgi:hypothetical protein
MAKNVIRVALPGYDAFTDTNSDHFALISDEDDILIKEYTRGSATISGSGETTIAHNLGYIPIVFAYYEKSTGVWAMPRMATATDSTTLWIAIDTTNLYIESNSYTGTVKYYIFYDQQV